MIGSLSNAFYDSETGRVRVQLYTSTINAYTNTVPQYGTYGIMSVPVANILVNLDQQVQTQVMATGYNNTIIDNNFGINAGEVVTYSTNWYSFNANSGIYMQPRNTSDKENAMMGQSTNAVLSDIMDLLVSIINYLGTHVHTGVTSGTDNSGIPLVPPPSDSAIISDQAYIGDNKNLAITGTYTPY